MDSNDNDHDDGGGDGTEQEGKAEKGTRVKHGTSSYGNKVIMIDNKLIRGLQINSSLDNSSKIN